MTMITKSVPILGLKNLLGRRYLVDVDMSLQEVVDRVSVLVSCIWFSEEEETADRVVVVRRVRGRLIKREILLL